jgi:hypothetical protein
MIIPRKIFDFIDNLMGGEKAGDTAIYATVFITLIVYLGAYPLLIMFVWNSVVANLYPNDPQDMLEKRKISYLTAFCIMLLLSFFI